MNQRKARSLRARQAAEWRTYLSRLAAYVPLPVERHDTSVAGSPWVLWTFAKIAVVLEPPEIAAPLGPWAGVWYVARRDANLLRECPICNARAGVTDMGSQPMRGQMVHEPVCPISDGRALLLKDEPFPEGD